MILSPAILALMMGSAATVLLALYASVLGVQVLRHWDLASGSEMQLALEKRTYLIATLMSYAFVFQVGSLFLFIFTVEDLHSLFVGAMCAAGTLNVNGFGYPAILLKICSAMLASLWLIFNHVDNRAYDYPLIRKKYALLLVLTPFLLAEAFFQGAYFLSLKAHVITSCCGSLFGAEGTGIGAGIGALPAPFMRILFFGSLAATLASGLHFWRKERGAYLFAGLSAAICVISLLSVLSFISLYVYELPTHHCPFCLLQKEYGYIGYPLYVTLFAGSILGVGTGALTPFRDIQSLSEAIPAIRKRMALAAVVLLAVFAIIVAWKMIFSNLTLDG